MATHSSEGKVELMLRRYLAGERLTAEEYDTLLSGWACDPVRAKALGIPQLTLTFIKQQLDDVQTLYPQLDQFCRDVLHWQSCPLETLWNLWLPLAHWLRQRLSNSPTIHGILGGQGTGKSTLVAILAEILKLWGVRVCCLSLDDLYLTYLERSQLQQQDPRLRWRGPPGTHDVALGLSTLKQLRQAHPTNPVEVPRFDKSLHNGAGDRTSPEIITGVDAVLFEGWFVGIRPIDPQQFDAVPNLVGPSGGSSKLNFDYPFAHDCNARLFSYLPLWDELDTLTLLKPLDYRLSQQWRRQAEHQMMASGRRGMGDQEINQFVEYFWQALHPELFIPALLHEPGHVDLVIEVNPDHSPGKIYCP